MKVFLWRKCDIYKIYCYLKLKTQFWANGWNATIQRTGGESGRSVTDFGIRPSNKFFKRQKSGLLENLKHSNNNIMTKNRDDLIKAAAQHIEWVCSFTTVRTDYTYRRIAFTAMMSWYHRSFNLRMLVWYLLYIFYQPENSLLLTSTSYIAL